MEINVLPAVHLKDSFFQVGQQEFMGDDTGQPVIMTGSKYGIRIHDIFIGVKVQVKNARQIILLVEVIYPRSAYNGKNQRGPRNNGSMLLTSSR